MSTITGTIIKHMGQDVLIRRHGDGLELWYYVSPLCITQGGSKSTSQNGHRPWAIRGGVANIEVTGKTITRFEFHGHRSREEH